jgi:hypothetical protein
MCAGYAIFVLTLGADRGSRSPFWLVLLFAALRANLATSLTTALALPPLISSGVLEHGIDAHACWLYAVISVGCLTTTLSMITAVFVIRYFMPPTPVEVSRDKPLSAMSAAEVRAQLGRPGGVQKLITDPLMFEKITALLRGENVNH